MHPFYWMTNTNFKTRDKELYMYNNNKYASKFLVGGIGSLSAYIRELVLKD